MIVGAPSVPAVPGWGFCRPCSLDLNPVEQVFARPKALPSKATERSAAIVPGRSGQGRDAAKSVTGIAGSA